MAYYLTEKGYDVTLIEKNSRVGGLARTCYYSGHPYEFGPHIWFWPGGEDDPVNHTIVRLTNDELFHIDRRLFTYIEADRPQVPLSGALSGHRPDAGAGADSSRTGPEPRRAHEADPGADARDRPAASSPITSPRRSARRCTRSSWRTTPGRCGTFPVTSSRRRWSGPIGSTTPIRRAGDKTAARGVRRLRSDQVRGSHARQGHPLPGLSQGRLERRLERDGRASRPWSAIASSAFETSTNSRTC